MDNKKIGNFIAERRKELGYSQKDLAEKLNITDKAVSKWETGRSAPEVSILIPLANLLGVSVTELLNGEEISREEINTASDELIVKSLEKYHIGTLGVAIAIYLITAVHYILGAIYDLGEYVLHKRLLPEPVWDTIGIMYHDAAAAITLLIQIAVLLILMIIIVSVYSKLISRISLILSATIVIPPLLCIIALWPLDSKVLLISAIILCIVHTVATMTFLIRDIKKLK